MVPRPGLPQNDILLLILSIVLYGRDNPDPIEHVFISAPLIIGAYKYELMFTVTLIQECSPRLTPHEVPHKASTDQYLESTVLSCQLAVSVPF